MEKLTAQLFVAKIAMTKNGVLTWDSTNNFLQLTAEEWDGSVVYAAPTPREMTVNGYSLFIEYVDTLWNKMTGHSLADLLIENGSMMRRLGVAEALEKIRTSDDNSIVGDGTAQLQITVWKDGVEESYLGPDPVTTGYVNYMHFLGQMEDLGCFGVGGFMHNYLKDRLRS